MLVMKIFTMHSIRKLMIYSIERRKMFLKVLEPMLEAVL